MSFVVRLALLALIAQGGASIDGIVVRSESGSPISGANVELRRAPPATGQALPAPPPLQQNLPVAADSRVATTATDGKFRFQNVAPGQYRLYATRSNGFVPGEFGQRTPTGIGSAFTITTGQSMTGITLTMTPTASISGRITESDGEPSGYAFVQAQKAVYKDGRRLLTVVQMVQADDRGDYRLVSCTSYPSLRAKTLPPLRGLWRLRASPSSVLQCGTMRCHQSRTSVVQHGYWR